MKSNAIRALVCAAALVWTMSWAVAETLEVETNFGQGSPNDCAVLRGAVLGEAALLANYTGYGDVKYWVRTFELQRDAANRVAESIKGQVVPMIDAKLLRVALSDIATDIFSAMQSGYGDVKYWISAVEQSNTTYERAAQKLRSIRSSICK